MDGATTIVPDTVPAPATLAEARARIPGWADLPKVNLFNSSGLPASPFRTDDWKSGGTTNAPR